MRIDKAVLVATAVAAAGIAASAQQQVGTPGVQAGRDPNRDAFVAANCKTRPAAAAPAAGGNQARGGGAPGQAANAGRGGGNAAAPAAPPVLVPPDPAPAIPGILAAGQRWRKVWTGSGNNTDGATGTDKGLLLAQNDLSQVIEISLADGSVEVLARDTFTGGALAVRPDGELYLGTRALNRGIFRLAPRTLFTNTMNGEPLECLGPAVLNDMVADKKGGIYMTMGGVYYANARGVVSGPYGTGGNGIAVSPDDKTLYVTGRMMGATPPADLRLPPGAPTPTGGIRAFDIRPDGTLANERQLGWGGGDGTAVDTQGRIYTPGNGGAWVIDPSNGQFLGFIPTPAGTHGLHFGGPNRSTLFSIQLNAQTSVYAIDTLVRGYQATEWNGRR